MKLEDKKLQEIMLSLLIQDDSEESLYEIRTSDSSYSSSLDEEVTLCPNNCNVITKDQSREELLFDIIEKIEEPEIKTHCLHKLKNLSLKDKITKSRIQPFSLKQVLETYEGHESSLSKPVTVKELKQEVNQLKVEVKELKNHIGKQVSSKTRIRSLYLNFKHLKDESVRLKLQNLEIHLLHLLLN